MTKENLIEISKILKKTDLLIFDFSAVVNIDINEFDLLINLIIHDKIEVAITDEFYKNYDIINNCDNEEQKRIAQKAYYFTEKLSQSGMLLNIEKVYSNYKLINDFAEKRRICYVFYQMSEMCEAIKQNLLNNEDVYFIVVDDNGNIITEKNNIIFTCSSVDESVYDDSFFEIEDLPKTDSIVRTKAGETITLGEFIAGGGEGDVFECNYKSDYLVKIYHNGQLNKLRIKKMLQMEKEQIRYNGLCWPEKVVYSKVGEPVGYVMKRVYGKSLSSVFDSYESVLENFPNWKKQDLIKLSIKILERIQYLHLFGILIGDLRMNNIMISSEGEPTLVDLDSCQIGNLPCPAGFGDFTPAELQRVEFSKQLRTFKNESFACAVLVFKILFCGLHPYDQRNGADTIEEEIALMSFPYPISVNESFDKIVYGSYDEIWKNTPYQFQALLYDIFKKGKRPNIQTMIMMLKTYSEFIEINKSKNHKINEFLFEEEK